MGIPKSYEIVNVRAREILADNNVPIVEAEVFTKAGIIGKASAPIGTRPLEHEAFQLRDGGKRYLGLGVRKAVENVNKLISLILIGKNVTRQSEIDESMIRLDGTENKSRLGSNAILAVSLAAADAASKALEIPLYRYIGGINANIIPVPIAAISGSYSRDGIQEHLIMPFGAKTYSEALRMDVEVHFEHKKMLENLGRTSDTHEILNRMLEAINRVGYEKRFKFCLDCAATHFYDRKKKIYLLMGKKLSREEMIGFYKDLVKSYPIFSIEDPLYQDDFEGHSLLTKELDVQIVGDDLFVTNLKRIKKGIEMGAGNALLLKPNQIGTLTETIDAAELAQHNDFKVMVSGRAGKPEDAIADICVALNCGQTKLGPLGIRNAKYNRLLEIEEELGGSAKYTNFSNEVNE